MSAPGSGPSGCPRTRRSAPPPACAQPPRPRRAAEGGGGPRGRAGRRIVAPRAESLPEESGSKGGVGKEWLPFRWSRDGAGPAGRGGETGVARECARLEDLVGDHDRARPRHRPRVLPGHPTGPARHPHQHLLSPAPRVGARAPSTHAPRGAVRGPAGTSRANGSKGDRRTGQAAPGAKGGKEGRVASVHAPARPSRWIRGRALRRARPPSAPRPRARRLGRAAARARGR